MFKLIYTLIILFITIYNISCNSNKKCIQQSPCLCVKDKYSKLDITSILGNNSHLKDTRNGITYYFLGCGDEKKPPPKNCSASSVYEVYSSLLKYNETSNNCTTIGIASSIKFEFANNYKDYQIVYNESGKVAASYPTIRLICDDFDTSFIKVINEETNELVLSSPKACFITEHPGLSDGSIFLLIFFITGGVYFFGGALLLYSIRGARGIEVIPNLDFWKNLPGLVKDGAIFLLSGCKPSFISTTETYDRI